MNRREFLKALGIVTTLAMAPNLLLRKKENKQRIDNYGMPSGFGDGSDGDVYLSADDIIELKRDMYFNRLDMSRGGTLITNGYRIYTKREFRWPGNGGRIIT